MKPPPTTPVLWATHPVSNGMQRMNLAWFSQMGVALQAVSVGGLEDAAGALQNFIRLRPFLAYLWDERLIPLSLRASRPLIFQMLSEMDKILSAPAEQQSEMIATQKENFYRAATKLIILLDADLNHQSVYLLERV